MYLPTLTLLLATTISAFTFSFPPPVLPSEAPSTTTACPANMLPVTQTVTSKDCNWAQMTQRPQPALSCWTKEWEEMVCTPTDGEPRTSSMLRATRSVRAVKEFASGVSTGSGGRSQRAVGQVARARPTTDLGGRSQRSVAHAALAKSTTNFGGRSQRSVVHEARVTSNVKQPGGQNGAVVHVTTLVTVTKEGA